MEAMFFPAGFPAPCFERTFPFLRSALLVFFLDVGPPGEAGRCSRLSGPGEGERDRESSTKIRMGCLRWPEPP